MSQNDKEFQQCVLKKGNRNQVAWIAVRGAKVGKILELKTGDKPDPGWEVMSVGHSVFDKSQMLAAQLAHRNQRIASDI